MDKKLFLYELKFYIKVPLIALAAYLAEFFVISVIMAFIAPESLRLMFSVLDRSAQGLLYGILVFTFVLSVYRTVAYEKLYAKVDKDSFAVLGTRMLCLVVCCVGAVLLLLFGGTIAELIFQARAPVLYNGFERSAIVFSLYRRSPFYFLFSLSVSMSALVMYAAASVVVNAVRAAKYPVVKILAGIVWSVGLFFGIVTLVCTVSAVLEAPTWGFGKLYAYPMPFDAYSEYYYRGGYGSPITVYNACWNICNLATLAGGALMILFAFAANAFFRRKTNQFLPKSLQRRDGK